MEMWPHASRSCLKKWNYSVHVRSSLPAVLLAASSVCSGVSGAAGLQAQGETLPACRNCLSSFLWLFSYCQSATRLHSWLQWSLLGRRWLQREWRLKFFPSAVEHSCVCKWWLHAALQQCVGSPSHTAACPALQRSVAVVLHHLLALFLPRKQRAVDGSHLLAVCVRECRGEQCASQGVGTSGESFSMEWESGKDC